VNRIGSSIAGPGARTAPVYDPATGEQTARSCWPPDDVDAAVARSRRPGRVARDISLTARSRILFAFRELADRHRDDLARLITAEHGKVTEDARG
jgi:malonate-semialdehyde dehydrogenase (acetylating)/methylmalonate-semialdehyde dehydrogenase